ncbi:hypothetical protein B0H10DRAFT_1937597 [Mycena sp. CBHHK59/15]|nr:hypothetical protein B0H10DRAFT_1937597 [Mycena sp. CBHHK59/15]
MQIPSKDLTFKFGENNWPLCQQDQIPAGSHVLTIQVQSNGQPFYFDSLVYTPLPGVAFHSAVLLYPHGDPAVSYGPGWFTDGQALTQTLNARATLNFHGESFEQYSTLVTLFGYIHAEYPATATFVSYKIDGGSGVLVTFPLKGRSHDDTQFNNILFTTPVLSDDFYNLTATSPPMIRRSKNIKGVIDGSIIGAVFVLVVLAAIYLWHQRRHLRATEATSASPYPMAEADGGPPVIQFSDISPTTSNSTHPERMRVEAGGWDTRRAACTRASS